MCSLVRPARPSAAEGPVVGPMKLMVLAEQDGVHHGERGEMEVGVVLIQKDLPEVPQAETVTRLVQGNRFHVSNGRIRVDAPGEVVVVVGLSEAGIELVIAV